MDAFNAKKNYIGDCKIFKTDENVIDINASLDGPQGTWNLLMLKKLFKRSVANHKLRYTSYVVDGD